MLKRLINKVIDATAIDFSYNRTNNYRYKVVSAIASNGIHIVCLCIASM